MRTALTRETLSDQVAQRLAEFIAAELRPGDLLPSEASLLERFEVSRPVVREALRSLAGQGLIDVVSGKGAIVRPVDDRLLRLFFQRAIEVESASLVELMEVRKPLEVQSAALASQRGTREDVEAIGAKVSTMRGHLEDLDAYAEHDVEFHVLVALASHNGIMRHLIGSIRHSLREAIQEGLRRRTSRAELERVQQLHEAIYRAIAARDAAAAADAMARHFDEAVTALITPPDA